MAYKHGVYNTEHCSEAERFPLEILYYSLSENKKKYDKAQQKSYTHKIKRIH